MLCQKCSNIVFQPDPWFPDDDQHLIYEHYDTFERLRISADNCHACHWFASAFLLQFDGKSEETGPVILAASLYGAERRRVGSLYVRCGGAQIQAGLRVVSKRLYQVPDEPCLAQRSNNHLLSSQNIDLAKRWMGHCASFHSSCGFKGVLPLWIIQISSDQDRPSARLVRGQDREAHYVTLSYKWGSVARYTLTSANKADLRREIPLQHIPRTFADAITVIHKLGYSYLWIDALCITQDVEAELHQQINSMQTVYSGSSLTLFAAAGNDAEAGLDRERDVFNTHPLQLMVQIPFETEHVSVGITIFRDRLADEELPLFQRGWVLQEEVLSRRALTFTDTQIAWRCLRDHLSERFPFRRKLPRDSLNYLSFDGAESDSLTASREWLCADHLGAGGFEPSLLDTFYDIVKAYCARQLTHESDVLFAISGLTSAYAERLNIAFVEGTCLNDIRGLLWRALIEADSVKRRPTLNRPSWSWTSHFGSEIDFWRDVGVKASSPSRTMQISLAQHTTESSNKLTVKSWTRWDNLEYRRGEGAIYCYFDNDRRDGGYEADRPRCFPDSWEDLLHSSTPTRRALFIYSTHAEKGGRYVCIVAVPHPEIPNCFTRFGIGVALDSDFFGDMEETDAVPESQRRTDGPDYTIQDLV